MFSVSGAVSYLTAGGFFPFRVVLFIFVKCVSEPNFLPGIPECKSHVAKHVFFKLHLVGFLLRLTFRPFGDVGLKWIF